MHKKDINQKRKHEEKRRNKERGKEEGAGEGGEEGAKGEEAEAKVEDVESTTALEAESAERCCHWQCCFCKKGGSKKSKI